MSGWVGWLICFDVGIYVECFMGLVECIGCLEMFDGFCKVFYLCKFYVL